MITKLLFAIGIIALIVALAWGCKEKKKEWWSHEKGFDNNCSICKKELKTKWMDSTKGKISFLEVTDTSWKGYWEQRTKPAQGIVITNGGKKKAEVNKNLDGDRTYNVYYINDTIPKKDTVPAELFTMPYMDKGIDPPSFGLEAPRYDYFYCEREVKAIRKELDSLKIEIQKLKSKQ